MMDAKTLRKARQTLESDRLMGMDFIPVRRVPVEAERSAEVAESPVEPRTEPSSATISVSGASRQERVAALAALATESEAWARANWPRDGWNRFVFGEGDPCATILFVGEGPGAEEDAQGRPFVGPAGQLLDKQIVAMGLKREQVYIGNIAKTRPPGNRVPTPEEAELWMPWLVRQIEIIAPRVIVTLGATSAKYLLQEPDLKITQRRGQWETFRGIDLMPTFHPAYLLRSYTPENRRRVWDDLQKVMERVGIAAPNLNE